MADRKPTRIKLPDCRVCRHGAQTECGAKKTSIRPPHSLVYTSIPQRANAGRYKGDEENGNADCRLTRENAAHLSEQMFVCVDSLESRDPTDGGHGLAASPPHCWRGTTVLEWLARREKCLRRATARATSNLQRSRFRTIASEVCRS